MNKIQNEILFFFSRKFLFSQLIIIQLIICFTVCMFSICFKEESKSGTSNYVQKYIETQYYGLSEYFINDNDDFLENDDSIKKLKLFYNQLKKEKSFKYAEIYQQSIYFKDFKGDDKFYYGYEYGKIRKNDDMSSLKAFWCGYDINEIFDLSLLKGQWFNEEIYYDTYSSPIPIVLGYSYSKLYNIGDIICGEGMTDSVYGNEQFKVIGFLSKDQTIMYQEQFVNLNHYIIFPLYNDINTSFSEEQKSILYRFYLMKTSGTILSTNSKEHVQYTINNICEELNIHPYYIVLGADNQQDARFIHTDIKRCNTLLSIISIVLIIFSGITLTAFEIIIVKQNLKYFAILLISGFKYSDIFKILFGQTIFFQVEALVFASCIFILLCKFFSVHIYLISFVIVIFMAFIITIISDIIAYKKIISFDLTEQLRRR